MKRLITFALVFVFTFTLFGCAVNEALQDAAVHTEGPTAAPTPEPTEAPTETPTEAATPEPTEAPTPGPFSGPTEKPVTPKQVVTCYLNDAAQYQYFYEPKDLSVYTVAGVAESDTEALTEAIAGYPAFRHSQKRKLVDDPELDSGSLEAILYNLDFQVKEVMYYSAIGEIYDIRYSCFELEYEFQTLAEKDGFILLDVFRGAFFNYEELPDDVDSGEISEYLISLVWFEDEWKILTVEEDSEFYGQYYGKDLDLEDILRGIREAAQNGN